MKISKDIKPVTYLKTKTSDLLKQINETHRPVVITQNGEPMAVLQDPESYENMRNAIGLLKLVCLGEDDVAIGLSPNCRSRESLSTVNCLSLHGKLSTGFQRTLSMCYLCRIRDRISKTFF